MDWIKIPILIIFYVFPHCCYHTLKHHLGNIHSTQKVVPHPPIFYSTAKINKPLHVPPDPTWPSVETFHCLQNQWPPAGCAVGNHQGQWKLKQMTLIINIAYILGI